MADSKRHTGWGVSINSTIESNIVEGSLSVSPNIQEAVLHAAGSLLPTASVMLTNAPQIQFSTRNIKLLDAPLKIGSGGFVACFRAYDDNGGLGSGYINLSVTEGLIVPQKISGQKGQPATLNVIVYPVSSDGDTNPITVGTGSLSLGAVGQNYCIGDAEIGSAISGVQSIDLDFGYEVKTTEGENGKPFPMEAYYDRQVAVLSVSTVQLSAASEARLNTGQSQTGNLSAVFRKLQEGAVPSGTYTITLAKAAVKASGIQAGRPATVQLSATSILTGAESTYLQFASA